MQRDGLLTLAGDRHLELTDEGRLIATRVMRKHRLAERLLVDVIGLEWEYVHEEACRWEHVMSERVERKILAMIGDHRESPYGNPIPGLDELGEEPNEEFRVGVKSLAELALTEGATHYDPPHRQPVQVTTGTHAPHGRRPAARPAGRGASRGRPGHRRARRRPGGGQCRCRTTSRSTSSRLSSDSAGPPTAGSVCRRVSVRAKDPDGVDSTGTSRAPGRRGGVAGVCPVLTVFLPLRAPAVTST